MGLFEQWGDVLRVLGRFLDSKEAEEIEIKNEQQLAVRWKSNEAGSASVAYTEFDITKLREQAPLMRLPVATPPKGDREEMLRTLGQEMDDQGVTVRDIVEVGGAYRVSGHDARGEVFRFYSRTELQKLSEKRRAMRRPPPESQPAAVDEGAGKE